MAAKEVSLSEHEAAVGAEVGVSDWLTVDQERINDFADVTLDHQYIHVDPEAAKASPFGGTIAHGFLTLSLLSALAAEVLPAIEGQTTAVNFGFNAIRFLSPVRSGQRVRARFELKAVRVRSPGVVQSTYGVAVEIDAELKPALVAEWLTLAYL